MDDPHDPMSALNSRLYMSGRAPPKALVSRPSPKLAPLPSSSPVTKRPVNGATIRSVDSSAVGRGAAPGG